MCLLLYSLGPVHRCRQSRVRAGVGPSLVIYFPHPLRPLGQLSVLGVLLLQMVDAVDAPRQTSPTSRMQPLMHVVGAVEVTDHQAVELLPQHLLDRLSSPARPVLEEVTHLGNAEPPEVATAAIFPPARLVPLHQRNGSNLQPQPSVLFSATLRRSTSQRHQSAHIKDQAKAPLKMALNYSEWQPALLP